MTAASVRQPALREARKLLAKQCRRSGWWTVFDPELTQARSTRAPESSHLLPRSCGCSKTARIIRPASCETQWRIDSRR